MTGKHEAVWDWLLTCPEIHDLYFNFARASDGDAVLIPESAYNDEWQDGMPYIDGSGMKNYDFAIALFKNFSTVPNSTENVEALIDAERIAGWIDAQGEAHNYPAFPENCTIMDLYTLPLSAGAIAAQNDTGVKYQFQFRIEYFYEKE